jgi:hypothetical protein
MAVMKFLTLPPCAFAAALSLSLSSFTTSVASPLVGTPFFGDPPDATHPWAIHDRNRPQPVRVAPGTFSTAEQPGQPPADAIVLFDGTPASLGRWISNKKEGGPAQWVIRDGALECVAKTGDIRTVDEFGDCQLHIEWAAPRRVEGSSQGRGNSGIFLLGLVEIQILDNYENPTYADGFAASVYGVNPPLANALRAPGEFQMIDIVFRRPVYDGDRVLDPGYVTVFCNGVLVQDHTPLEGPTGHMRRTKAGPLPAKGPLKLQDHGNPVRFRNIWYRPLPPRAVEGGTDGQLSPAATQAKREQIAAFIRADAASMASGSREQAFRLGESLIYSPDPEIRARLERMAFDYVDEVATLPASDREARKAEILETLRVLRYATTHGLLARDFAPWSRLEQVIKDAGWDDVKK